MTDSSSIPVANDHSTETVDHLLEVKIYAPFQVYFEGQATSVSAVNATGPFDILPKHYNFLCMLVPCTIDVKSPSGDKLIKVDRALMHVAANTVDVYVDV